MSDKVTIKEASKFLNVSEATVRNWIKTNILNLKEGLIYKDELIRVKKNIEDNKIDKLSKRANKFNLNSNFIPQEYLEKDQFYKSNISIIKKIIDLVKSIKNYEVEKIINFLLLKYLKISGLINIDKDCIVSDKKILLNEIKSWSIDLKDKTYSKFLEVELPFTTDPVGIIYQSIFKEGEKSKKGSYYTPINIIKEIRDLYIRKDSLICDPCCGTGQFLLVFSEYIENPCNIYGFDIDEIAIKITKINLMIRYKDFDFYPNIFYFNPLLKDYDESIKFDIIATNPPWGAFFSEQEVKILEKRFPLIKSKESFSYFLLTSLNLLKNNGILSFILPESILNVKIHSDIREILLKYFIKGIKSYGKIFKKVFSSIIRLDLQNKKNYSLNKDIFNINLIDRDYKIINKVFDFEHITLKENAIWGLGIVTGNNNKYLISEKKMDLSLFILVERY